MRKFSGRGRGCAADPGQLHSSPKTPPTRCVQSTFQGLLAGAHLDGLFPFSFFWLVHKKFSHFHYSKFSPVMTNPGLCRGTSHCNFGWDYASIQGQRAARQDGVPPGTTDPSKPLPCQIIVPKLPLSLRSFLCSCPPQTRKVPKSTKFKACHCSGLNPPRGTEPSSCPSLPTPKVTMECVPCRLGVRGGPIHVQST